MLDAISDFWKPSRKTDDPNQINVDAIKPGFFIGFGFLPQTELSGKRVAVSDINTYIFESDRMTSFVLEGAANTTVSMIISDSEQEKYVALSRKVPFAERASLFDNSELLACMDGDEKKRLTVKNEGKWAPWTTSEYKKAIGGLKGRLINGDYRGLSSMPDEKVGSAFNYTLLVSSNNEFALEIEQYDDNKIEVYATVYRRLSDIGEITPPQDNSQFELAPSKPNKVAKTASELAALKPANDSTMPKETPPSAPQPMAKLEPKIEEIPQDTSPPPSPKPDQADDTKGAGDIKQSTPKKRESLGEIKIDLSESTAPLDTPAINQPGPMLSYPAEASAESTLETLPDQIEPVKDIVPSLNTSAPREVTFFKHDAKHAKQDAKEEDMTKQEPSPKPSTEEATPAENEEISQQSQANEPKPNQGQPTQEQPSKEQTMATFNANLNGNTESKADVFQARAIISPSHEVENDTVECELPAANRVIEEAIRNEMSMSDVIRRVISLPVARQESVSIPVMLTDSDYSLLAVRYGIPAADRAAIKAKIMEELGEFSGK